jgi:AcrR family transcriptional regulator
MVTTERAVVDRMSVRAGSARVPGARALRTRQRLLGAVDALIREIPFHQVTTAHVTQRAGLSPPAFYRYFADLGDAIVALTPRMAASVHGIAEIVRAGDWSRRNAASSVHPVTEALEAFWAEHRALYRVTELMAEEHDPRFTAVKAETFVELTDAFVAAAGRRPSRAPRSEAATRASAAIVVTLLVHTTAREVGFAEAGIPLDALRADLARTVADVLTRSP